MTGFKLVLTLKHDLEVQCTISATCYNYLHIGSQGQVSLRP